MIQNISGLKPIPFSLLFHDLKVVVNRSYDYMFIRGVFIDAICLSESLKQFVIGHELPNESPSFDYSSV